MTASCTERASVVVVDPVISLDLLHLSSGRAHVRQSRGTVRRRPRGTHRAHDGIGPVRSVRPAAGRMTYRR